MTEHNFLFIATKSSPTVVLSHPELGDLTPGNRLVWSMRSMRYTEDIELEALQPDGGLWIGSADVLPGDTFHVAATFFPDRESNDGVQVAGPLFLKKSESMLAVTGGFGKFIGARGEARCVITMSDEDTPLYKYRVSFETPWS